MTQLTCREVVEFLMDYLDDALEPARRRIFEYHLAECDECVAYLRDYEQTVRLGKVAFADCDAAANEQLPRGLVDAILAARRRGA
jgi:anti-sigma factor RsiW